MKKKKALPEKFLRFKKKWWGLC